MNLKGMLKEAQKIQKEIQEVQKEIENGEYKGTAGGSLVNIIINGKKEIIDIDIDSSLLTSDSKEDLQDLIISAFKNASETVDNISNEKLEKYNSVMNGSAGNGLF